jgi:hypothetical protein
VRGRDVLATAGGTPALRKPKALLAIGRVL